jgi:hypothetical protein
VRGRDDDAIDQARPVRRIAPVLVAEDGARDGLRQVNVGQKRTTHSVTAMRRHWAPMRPQFFCDHGAATNEGEVVRSPPLRMDPAMRPQRQERPARAVLGTPNNRPMCEMDSWLFLVDRVVLKVFRIAPHGACPFRMLNLRGQCGAVRNRRLYVAAPCPRTCRPFNREPSLGS